MTLRSPSSPSPALLPPASSSRRSSPCGHPRSRRTTSSPASRVPGPIVYARDVAGETQLVVLMPDGAEAILPNTQGARGARWSPDATMLAFGRFGEGIFVVEPGRERVATGRRGSRRCGLRPADLVARRPPVGLYGRRRLDRDRRPADRDSQAPADAAGQRLGVAPGRHVPGLLRPARWCRLAGGRLPSTERTVRSPS